MPSSGWERYVFVDTGQPHRRNKQRATHIDKDSTRPWTRCNLAIPFAGLEALCTFRCHLLTWSAPQLLAESLLSKPGCWTTPLPLTRWHVESMGRECNPSAGRNGFCNYNVGPVRSPGPELGIPPHIELHLPMCPHISTPHRHPRVNPQRDLSLHRFRRRTTTARRQSATPCPCTPRTPGKPTLASLNELFCTTTCFVVFLCRLKGTFLQKELNRRWFKQ